MNREVFGRGFLALALVLSTGSAGCAGKKTHLHGEAVAAGGVRVSPSEVFSNSAVLVVKINVVNDAAGPITLDTDAVRLTLADGRNVSPSSHGKTKTIESHASELVRIDFRSDGFKWKEVARAQLNMTGAVLIKGSPTTIPPIELTLGESKGPPLAVVEKGRITIAEQIQFRTDSAEIVPESEEIVVAVAEILSSSPKITKVRIEGHTDNKGKPAANLDLSKRRAASVMAALVAKGISKERLKSTGFGETKPLESNATEDGRHKNRRVEFHIED